MSQEVFVVSREVHIVDHMEQREFDEGGVPLYASVFFFSCFQIVEPTVPSTHRLPDDFLKSWRNKLVEVVWLSNGMVRVQPKKN